MRLLRLAIPLMLFGCSSSSAPLGDGPVGDGGDDGGAADAVVDAAPETSGTQCTSARQTAVGPIDSVSTGTVSVISDTGGVKTLFVDATAGDISTAPSHPWIYLNLKTATRVDVNDDQAFTSSAWDLAFKRDIIHTNSGDAGPGKGGAVMVTTAFDALSSAGSASPEREVWFDASCNLYTDAVGGIKTTFSGWYDYDATTNHLTPHPGAWVVRAADGSLYKLAIVNYYGTPSGGTSSAGANYIVEYAALP